MNESVLKCSFAGRKVLTNVRAFLVGGKIIMYVVLCLYAKNGNVILLIYNSDTENNC